MAVLKLSQISAAGSNLGSSDFLVAVQSGTTDVLFTAGNIFAFANLLISSNTLSMINPASGTIAQSFYVYNTFTNTSNYERAVIDWTTTSNVLTIGTQVLGTGIARQINFVSGVGHFFYIGATGRAQVGVASGAGILYTDQLGLDYSNGDTILARGAAGIFKFASSQSFTANGLVATTLTSLGPTGANTTVAEWLTIKNASGTTRYIPCF